ncbi:MAG: hypothetical protein A3H27_05055 [Acidobacteria bacterium RIFCSPLOWO2_02_FULL_59_13]|nr:MAG: hypothetical protein A3H27_05055 [Acidobacteria bacterium RIFCSPLOWO2_02_FULL_59_13]
MMFIEQNHQSLFGDEPFLFRFDFGMPASTRDTVVRTLPLLLVAGMTTFTWFRLYEGLWRYVRMRDIAAILKAVTLGSGIFIGLELTLLEPPVPWAMFVVDWLMCLALVSGARLVLRGFRESNQ